MRLKSETRDEALWPTVGNRHRPASTLSCHDESAPTSWPAAMRALANISPATRINPFEGSIRRFPRFIYRKIKNRFPVVACCIVTAIFLARV